jgi:hypothetical protein
MLPFPERNPNLNAFSERWVRSVKDDCLSKLILFGKTALRRALREHLARCHAERKHRVKTMSCYLRLLPKQSIVLTDQLAVKNA